MEDLGEIVGEFLMESHENLDQIDRDLVDLEQEPDSRDLISRIFRAIHTIKGTSGFLAFNRLETLAHAGESLLSRLRDGVQPVTPATITTLLATIDGVRSLLAAIEENGTEGDVDVDSIIAAGPRPDERGRARPRRRPRRRRPESPPRRPSRSRSPSRSARRPSRWRASAARSARCWSRPARAQPADVGSALQQQLEGDERKLGTILLEEGKAQPAAVNEALQAADAQARASPTAPSGSTSTCWTP